MSERCPKCGRPNGNAIGTALCPECARLAPVPASTEREAQAWSGYDLAGCADRAGVVVRTHDGCLPLAATYERFASEIKKSLAARASCEQPGPETALREAAKALCDAYNLDGIAPPTDLWWKMRGAIYDADDASHASPQIELPSELRELSEKATPGDWAFTGEPDGFLYASHPQGRQLVAQFWDKQEFNFTNSERNADFIVAAVNFVRSLAAGKGR